MVTRNYTTKKPIPYERDEQAAYFRRAEQAAKSIDPAFGYIRGSMSAGKRSRLFKLQGLKAGYPDISWDLPRGKYHGLRIELKRRNYKPSDIKPKQYDWNLWLLEQGYLAMFCGGCDDAWNTTVLYYKLSAGEEIKISLNSPKETP